MILCKCSWVTLFNMYKIERRRIPWQSGSRDELQGSEERNLAQSRQQGGKRKPRNYNWKNKSKLNKPNARGRGRLKSQKNISKAKSCWQEQLDLREAAKDRTVEPTWLDVCKVQLDDPALIMYYMCWIIQCRDQNVTFN